MESKVLRVPSDCAWVVKNATHVSVNEKSIPAYAEFILDKYRDKAMPELFSPQCHYISDNREDTLSYVVALDSINFASGYMVAARGEYGLDMDYYRVANSLKSAFEDDAINTPQKWLDVKVSDLFNYFAIEQGKYPKVDTMFGMFVQSLHTTGANITNDYAGKVENMVEAAEFSAVKMGDILAGWDNFKDSAQYKGREIYILKRAQILPADIDLIYRPYLSDVDRLTIFADNIVPHTLRHDGVLDYSQSLQDRISSGIPLPQGSEEEVEMRAASIHAVELMKQYLHNTGTKNIRSVDLDRVLWHRGEDEKAFRTKRTHLVETSAY